MKNTTVKRNYPFFVYQVLKAKTSETGEHLSADKIADAVNDMTGQKPDIKTVFKAIGDLKELGVDIRCAKGRGNTGYYLVIPRIPLHQLRLIYDGIESLNIHTDDKTDIYESLEKVTGLKTEDFGELAFDNTKTQGWAFEQKFSEKMKLISDAIKKEKKIYLSAIFCDLTDLSLFPLDKTSQAELESVEPMMFSKEVNPYQIFRNKNNEPCLLFYCRTSTEYMVGVIMIEDAEMIEMGKDDIDPYPGLRNRLLDVDYAEFVSAEEFRKGRELRKCLVVFPENKIRGLTLIVLDNIIQHRQETRKNNQDVWELTYFKKDEEQLFELLLEVSNEIKLYPEFAAEGEEETMFERMLKLYQNMKVGYERYDLIDKIVRLKLKQNKKEHKGEQP